MVARRKRRRTTEIACGRAERRRPGPVRTPVAVVRDYLPRGNTLDDETFRRRHLLLCWVLGLHVPALFAFGVWQGFGASHSAIEVAVPLACLAFARMARNRRAGRLLRHRRASCTARRSWCTCPTARSRRTSTSSSSSASSPSTRTGCRSCGTWCSPCCRTGWAASSPPTVMFNHEAAQNRPWTWAVIHGVAVLAACVGRDHLLEEHREGAAAQRPAGRRHRRRRGPAARGRVRAAGQPGPPQPVAAQPAARGHHRPRGARAPARRARRAVPARPPGHPHPPQRRVAARAVGRRPGPPLGPAGARSPRWCGPRRRGRGLPPGRGAGQRPPRGHGPGGGRPGAPAGRADRERHHLLAAHVRGAGAQPPGAGESGAFVVSDRGHRHRHVRGRAGPRQRPAGRGARGRPAALDDAGLPRGGPPGRALRPQVRWPPPRAAASRRWSPCSASWSASARPARRAPAASARVRRRATSSPPRRGRWRPPAGACRSPRRPRADASPSRRPPPAGPSRAARGGRSPPPPPPAVDGQTRRAAAPAAPRDGRPTRATGVPARSPSCPRLATRLGWAVRSPAASRRADGATAGAAAPQPPSPASAPHRRPAEPHARRRAGARNGLVRRVPGAPRPRPAPGRLGRPGARRRR